MTEDYGDPRDLLLPARLTRLAAIGVPIDRLTDSQHALMNSPYRMTIAWGANGIGKSVGIAKLVEKALAGELSWQTPGKGYTVILCGKTWAQLGSTVGYLFNGRAKSWFRQGVRFEGGGLKGQRLQVFDVVSGPGKGGQLRLGTFRAENLAGPRADVVATDEPLPEDVYNELWPRLLGRNGRMYQTYTPTLGTTAKLGYIWDKVDDPSIEWAGEIQTELTLDAVTPRGRLVELPWITQQEIDEFEAGLSAIERDMRMGRTRVPRMDTAYFSAWGPHLLSEDMPPAGTPVGIGIDHGSRPGAQRAVLVAVGGTSIHAEAWIMDEYKPNGRSKIQQDARGILDMLARHGMAVDDVELWVGDRAHHGDRRGGYKSNERLKAAIAKELGHDTTRRGYTEQLPKPLRYMHTPQKYDRSVWEGCEIIHRLMVGDRPRFHVSPRCVHLAEDMYQWQGAKTDPHKDGIDAMRYIVVPMVEGRKR